MTILQAAELVSQVQLHTDSLAFVVTLFIQAPQSDWWHVHACYMFSRYHCKVSCSSHRS